MSADRTIHLVVLRRLYSVAIPFIHRAQDGQMFISVLFFGAACSIVMAHLWTGLFVFPIIVFHLILSSGTSVGGENTTSVGTDGILSSYHKSMFSANTAQDGKGRILPE